MKTIIEVCVKKRIKKDKDDPVGGKPGEKGLSMKFLNKLERKFGRYAVPNLMLYIIILNAAGLLIPSCIRRHSTICVGPQVPFFMDRSGELFHLFLCHTRQALLIF